MDDIIKAGAIKEGALWVDTTSGVPSVSSRIYSKLEDVGVKYLDCGVAGGPAAAEKGKALGTSRLLLTVCCDFGPLIKTGILSAMVGGEGADLEKVRPLLDLMMANVVHIGPVGSGHAVKVGCHCLFSLCVQ